MPAAVRSAQAAVCANQAARQRSSATPPPQGSSGRKSPANRQSPQIGQSVKEKAAEAPKVEEEEAPKSCPRRTCRWVLDFLDQTWLQTLQYIIFLFAFQSLTGTIRKSEEFYFDKYLTDTFIGNTFDADHNRFLDTRRVADIWEWKRTVLTPGLFSHSRTGEYWPDGDGVFSLEGATPLSTANVVDMDNFFSFTQGIIFKQVRRSRPAEATPDPACI